MITLTRFLYHIRTNPETPEDSVHYFRDGSGQWLAYTFDEKSAAASAAAAAAGSGRPQTPDAIAATAFAAAAARVLPPDQNEKLLNTLRQHFNQQNLYYDGNYDLPGLPDVSSNSCSSLSLNSAGAYFVVYFM